MAKKPVLKDSWRGSDNVRIWVRSVAVGVGVVHFGRPGSRDIWTVATESLKIVGGGTWVRVVIVDLRDYSDPFDIKWAKGRCWSQMEGDEG